MKITTPKINMQYALDKNGNKLSVGSNVTLDGVNSDGTKQTFTIIKDQGDEIYLLDPYRKHATKTSLLELSYTSII